MICKLRFYVLNGIKNCMINYNDSNKIKGILLINK